MPQNIRDVMTSNPCTIDADQSVAYAAKMMREEDVGLAPIVEGDKLIGMLTDRDIATRVAAQGKNPDQVKVRDVASTQLITIDPQQDLDEALRMMAKHQVRRLPVVEEDGRLVGVVAQADIAREGDDRQTGQLVEEISESGGQMSSIEEGQQFPRQVEERQESVAGMGAESVPGLMDEQREEEGVSKVQAASSRGRKRRSTSRKRSSGTRARSTTRKSSTGTRKRKTSSRKKSSTGSRKRKTSSRKRSTGRMTVKTAGRRGGRKAATRKRSTAKRKTASRKRSTTSRKRKTSARKSTGTRKRKTTSRKRSTAKRSTASRKRSTSTRKRSTSSRKKSSGTRKRKTTSRKRSTGSRTTVKTAGRRGGRTTARRRTTRRKSR
jgi:CBS domain-containing protein